MKLTVDYLKRETRNFDLECVFVLDLSNKDIDELDQISSCTNVEIINLSKNNLSDLAGLKNLANLQYANLSNNKITSLVGLENLESLKTLNLSGNNIQDIDQFFKLRDLKNLTCLILNDSVTKASNPVCKNQPLYRKSLKQILPNLELVDGQSYKLDVEIYTEEISESKDHDFLKNTNLSPNSNSWFDQLDNFSEKRANIDKITKCLEEERQKFKKIYEEILESMEKSNQNQKI
ncbi:Leucine-rich repeat-containing 61 [Brachionus plicatilis]|uniref:Leucine-rich repeat-containing 61 n=1 Tax=Brachionus plicatilis TaxID=10195 RepID=A0A3M7QR46_BRAPC|nr:Leucine-rich repeat-containing 61 [Brachionus plicatilis]